MEFNTVIPAGGKYITANGTELKEGDTFPKKQTYPDAFYYGDYAYLYRNNGWTVKATDKSKSTYGEILESIGKTPVTSMYSAYSECEFLITIPKIPDSIRDIRHSFENCKSLTTIPNIPTNVTSLCFSFFGCESLTSVPEIPDNVTNMNHAFENCKSLKIIPNIPNKITSLRSTFLGCKSLISIPEIPDNVFDMHNAFAYCSSLVSIPNIPRRIRFMNFTFYKCNSLALIPPIPKNVKELYSAFLGCTTLKTINFKSPNTDIKNSFDEDVSKLTIKGLSGHALEIAKEKYPNIKFESTKSQLSQFLEDERSGDLREI